MTQTAMLIGTLETCRRLERQLHLLADRPVTIGWVITSTGALAAADAPVLGGVNDLEAIVARRRPGLALICLPAAMSDLIASVRTRLRRLRVPERFMPTLEDQLAGVGPRSTFEIDLTKLLDRSARRIDDASIRALLRGRRVLITGAGGSIGSELARIAAAYEPAELVLVDRSENALFEIDRQIARRAPDLIRRAVLHDVVEAARTLDLFETIRPEIIFHAAAHKHVPMMEDHPGAAVDNNLFGTKSVADAAHAVHAQRFVMISTDKAVNPVSIMGMTKRLGEMYVQHIGGRSSTGFSLVRFGNVLGSTGSVLDIWTRQLAEGGPITVTDPRMTRYFMTIPEAAALVLQSAALTDPTSAGGEVFVLDMGEPIRVVELARRFAAMHGLTARTPGTPGEACSHEIAMIDVVFTGARPGEKIHEELGSDAESTRSTAHPDIRIWVLAPPEKRDIEQMLESLAPLRQGGGPGRPGDTHQIANLIRSLVGEMKACMAA